MNKSSSTAIMAAALTLATSCTNVQQAEVKERVVIGKQEITVSDGRLTPEALWAMGRIGGLNVSPDGKKIVYNVSYYSVPENKSHSVIYVMNSDGTNNKLLTTTVLNERDPQWIKGGTKIAFLCNESGGNQIWEMNSDGTDRRLLSHFNGDIEGFSFSPDEEKVLFIAQVKYGERTADIYEDLPLSSGKVINDLMYKHWDEWVESVPHPFVANFNGSKMGQAIDILKDEPFESPMKPFGGIEQLAWSSDSKSIAYTSRKKTGLKYAVSTDSDIFLYHLDSKTTANICKQNDSDDRNLGYDINPKFSPDGNYIAWQSMERDGYESDRNRLCIYNLKTGEKKYVTEKFDSNVDDFCWSNVDGKLYFIGVWHGTTQIYSTDFDGHVKQITEGVHDYASVAMMNDQLIAKRHSMSHADEIFTVTPTDGKATQITHENDHIFNKLNLGKVESRWIKTTDNKDMLTWVIYPSNFNPNKKYPALLFCEGGPQSPVSQFWSFRWNFQIMAANDYIIVAPNRRGLPGFGSEWLEQISGDYGGQCMKDYLSAIDEVSKEPYVDKDRLGCVGASFGGFSVYWLAGHHDKRFKAFIAHDGIFNMEMQYLETEEKWFANWDMGGAYWEKDNKVAQKTFANSPHRFVDKWDTPILCIHGEKDYRILANQAMAAFDAATMRGIPAELLIFPDENHWVLKPQNGILWQRRYFNWLDKWLKK